MVKIRQQHKSPGQNKYVYHQHYWLWVKKMQLLCNRIWTDYQPTKLHVGLSYLKDGKYNATTRDL